MREASHSRADRHAGRWTSDAITVEGFIVVSSAEQIATWIAGRALQPRCAPQRLHLSCHDRYEERHRELLCPPMPWAMRFATVEFLRRWCGMRIAVGSGEYCAAKQPSLYTALEKAHKSMTVSAFTGQPASPGGGLLDEGRALPPLCSFS